MELIPSYLYYLLGNDLKSKEDNTALHLHVKQIQVYVAFTLLV